MTNPSQILTSILASLKEVSQQTVEKQTLNEASEPESEARYRKRTKDRKRKEDLPEEARNILLTFHVLFPHILLDALDLLDRGCVVRIITQAQHSDEAPKPPQKPEGGESTGPEKQKRTTHHVAHYVLSTRQRQPYTKHHSASSITRPDTNPTQEQVIQQLEDGAGHTIHLQAWNCSCPAFALAAYAEGSSALHAAENLISSTSHPEISTYQNRNESRGENEKEEEKAVGLVRFGGLSIPRQRKPAAADPAAGSQEEAGPAAGVVEGVLPPVCKHLLAVVLSEVAPGLFGPFAGGTEEATLDTGGDEDKRRGVWDFVVSEQGAAGLAAGMGSGW